MCSTDIVIRQGKIPFSHAQCGVSHSSLEREYVTAVAEKLYGVLMPQIVAGKSFHSGFLSVPPKLDSPAMGIPLFPVSGAEDRDIDAPFFEAHFDKAT
jgi:hypothetical protein